MTNNFTREISIVCLACVIFINAGHGMPDKNEIFDRLETVIQKSISLEESDKNHCFASLSFLLYQLANGRFPEDARSHELYRKVQAALLAIPGHAEYQFNQINIARGKQAPPTDPLQKHEFDSIASDDEIRSIPPFSTLVLLPSPETVSVLGRLLNDDEPTKHPMLLSHMPNSAGPIPCGQLAAAALSQLLANPPAAMGPDFLYSRDIPTWRYWFEQIKAGNQTFRFADNPQKAEYRFKSDNTWESITIANPPDDAPKPKPRPAVPGKSDSPPAATPLWPWLGGGVLAALAALAYFLKSRKPSGKPPTSTS